MFQHLTVKAFLALRPHTDQLINTVRLRDRFALGMSERSAASWMMNVAKNVHENVRSTAYDEFLRVGLR